MKTSRKALICIVFTLFTCISMTAAVTAARHSSVSRYMQLHLGKAIGEKQYVYFGKYPQSRVVDEKLLSLLNTLHLTWKSYGYYNGDGSIGSATQSDFMVYADVEFEGETYRAVKLSKYRSYCCHQPSVSSWQSPYVPKKVWESVFELDTVYWYRFDPIRWIVLSSEECLLFSEAILDSQPINSLIYSKKPKASLYSREFYKDADCKTVAADYYTSNIREWLNSTFLETAFSEKEVEQIKYSDLDNSSWTYKKSKYDSKDSTDRVFLLSYDDATNPSYGFSSRSEKLDKNRVAYPTPYSLCQGIWTHESRASYWWLRTAKGNVAINGAALNLAVNYAGTICLSYPTPYAPDCIDTGTRPAIRLTELPNIEPS